MGYKLYLLDLASVLFGMLVYIQTRKVRVSVDTKKTDRLLFMGNLLLTIGAYAVSFYAIVFAGGTMKTNDLYVILQTAYLFSFLALFFFGIFIAMVIEWIIDARRRARENKSLEIGLTELARRGLIKRMIDSVLQKI